MTRRDALSAGVRIPGFCLSALAVVVAVGAATALGVRGGWLIGVAVLAVLGAASPPTGGLWMAAGVLAAFLMLAQPDPVRTAVTVGAVHLLHVLASLALAVPPTAGVAVRALAPTGIRFAVVQLVAQALALAVGLLPAGADAPWAAIAGGAAVLALLAIGLRSLRMRRATAYRAPS